MVKNFDLAGTGKKYDPTDYGLPIWRDEDHLPPEETKQEPTPSADASATMTVEAAKLKLCMWARKQVGYHEGANNQNKYADNPDLARMYGWVPQNQPWCDVFVDDGFISCFGLKVACAMTYQPMGAGSALCRQSAQYYKDHGAFVQQPEIGDQIFFYSGGDINHTGIVVGVDGGSVVTIEGNSSDQVAERIYSTSDVKIAGYGRPDWSVVAGTESGTDETPTPPPDTSAQQGMTTEKRTYMLAFPYLSRGMTGDAVMAVQITLLGRGFGIGPDGADGDFGANTESAVRRFQQRESLTADGIVGPNTGARLFGGEVYTPGASVQAGRKEAKQESGQGNVLGAFKNLFRRKD